MTSNDEQKSLFTFCLDDVQRGWRYSDNIGDYIALRGYINELRAPTVSPRNEVRFSKRIINTSIYWTLVLNQIAGRIVKRPVMKSDRLVWWRATIDLLCCEFSMMWKQINVLIACATNFHNGVWDESSGDLFSWMQCRHWTGSNGSSK